MAISFNCMVENRSWQGIWWICTLRLKSKSGNTNPIKTKMDFLRLRLCSFTNVQKSTLWTDWTATVVHFDKDKVASVSSGRSRETSTNRKPTTPFSLVTLTCTFFSYGLCGPQCARSECFYTHTWTTDIAWEHYCRPVPYTWPMHSGIICRPIVNREEYRSEILLSFISKRPILIKIYYLRSL